MNTFRLESIRKMPELVLRTVDHGVVHCCARCDMELDKSLPAVSGTPLTREWCSSDFKIPSYSRPRCPHCLYEHKEMDNYISKASATYLKRIFLNPVPLKIYRKYEHVIKVKKTFWGGEKIVDSVIEMQEIPNAS